MIDETEALVAIDVNTGRNKGGRDVEKTILQTNLEAADEIARQLRLRNIGGLIIGDFIDMKSRKDQQAVYSLMKERLKRDKAKTHVLPISQLGLMEMTRQRAQESLSDSIYENCPYCGGRGVVKTSMTTSVELHRTLNTVMRKYQDSIHDIRVILNPDVLKRLKEEDEELAGGAGAPLRGPADVSWRSRHFTTKSSSLPTQIPARNSTRKAGALTPENLAISCRRPKSRASGSDGEFRYYPGCSKGVFGA